MSDTETKWVKMWLGNEYGAYTDWLEMKNHGMYFTGRRRAPLTDDEDIEYEIVWPRNKDFFRKKTELETYWIKASEIKIEIEP